MSLPKYKTLTDQELVSLCLKGDGHAWEALIVRYRRLIYSIPVRFNFSSADAADVFQAVCLKLIEHLHELKDDTKVPAWLVTTTTRQCIYVRSQRARETTSDDEFKEPADPLENVEHFRLQTERDQTLREAVEELPKRCRSLIEMLYFDNRSPSYDVISHDMAMPVSSIGPTRARCLDKLRQLLRRKGIR